MPRRSLPPSVSIEAVSQARPFLPGGSKAAPLWKIRLTSTSGESLCCSSRSMSGFGALATAATPASSEPKLSAPASDSALAMLTSARLLSTNTRLATSMMSCGVTASNCA